MVSPDGFSRRPREDDRVIDLRERLAPYAEGDPSPGWSDGLVAAEMPRAKAPQHARSPQPRHLAPNHPAVLRPGLGGNDDEGPLGAPPRGVIPPPPGAPIPPPPGAPISPPPGASGGAVTADQLTTNELLIALGRQVVAIRKAVQLLALFVATELVVGLIWALVILTEAE
jgi:hypothetical protein